MVYLIYAILKAQPHPEIDEDLKGVRGKPVIFIEGHTLCAAVSVLDSEERTPPLAELVAYARVVETIHRRQCVIPMRYGCFLNGIPSILDALNLRRSQYETLLAELEGHVEMGIRIILNKVGGEDIPKDSPAVTNEKSAIDGRGYLALRKIHYQIQEESSNDRQMFIDRHIQAFSGLYARYRSETETKNGVAILSLYFLIPESAINIFRKTFNDTMAKADDDTTLSGPWPPYNFVTTDKG